MAITDTPSYAFAEELIDAYPEAKVVLTVRDSATSWRESMMTTVLFTTNSMNDVGVLGKVVGWFAPRNETKWYQPMFEMVLGMRIYETFRRGGRRFMRSTIRGCSG